MSDHEVRNFFPNLLSRIITLHHRVRLKKAGQVISSTEIEDYAMHKNKQSEQIPYNWVYR